MNTTTTLHVRWAVMRDLPRVAAIEAGTFGGWKEADFLARLRQRNCIAMVAVCGDEILGFAVYELHPYAMVVTNLAGTRAALAALVAKMHYKADAHRREMLVWDCE